MPPPRTAAGHGRRTHRIQPSLSGTFWNMVDTSWRTSSVRSDSGPGATLWLPPRSTRPQHHHRHSLDTQGTYVALGSGMRIRPGRRAYGGIAGVASTCLCQHARRDDQVFKPGTNRGCRRRGQSASASMAGSQRRYWCSRRAFHSRGIARPPAANYRARVTGRWSRALAADSRVELQAIPAEYRNVAPSVHARHRHRGCRPPARVHWTARHRGVWGTRYRSITINHPGTVSFEAARAQLPGLGAFAQDEMAIRPTGCICGRAKVERNTFSGINGSRPRASGAVGPRQMIWAAPRAPWRRPTRLDVDVRR